jgi:hypothetical protein
VDGAEGRGSYSGLWDSLHALYSSLSLCLADALAIAEDVFSDPSAGKDATLTQPIDLIIGGIWKIVSAALVSGFPGMFSCAITLVFHRSYHAVDRFLTFLGGICGPRHSDSISKRLQSHPSVIEFRAAWKLDLYAQVRVLIRPYHIPSLPASLPPSLLCRELPHV